MNERVDHKIPVHAMSGFVSFVAQITLKSRANWMAIDTLGIRNQLKSITKMA